MKKVQECYYKNLSACSCSFAPYANGACVGKDACTCYISENEYFQRMLDGTLPEVKVPTEDPKKRQERINKLLTPEKSKKQLKYEQRKEDEKNGLTGGGFRLGDDPRFRDIFGKK